MAYRLGIDLGTTFTAAAVLRDGERPDALPLGARAHAAPSVVFLDAGGRVLFGDDAEDRAPDAPERVARHFKRRIGDEVPMVLGGTTEDRTECYAHDLAAAVIAWVVAVAAEREGARPIEIAVTHPAGWSRRKLDLLLGAIEVQDLPPVTLITEPEAAAVGYAGTGLIEHPATLAVYDLGGGTLDVAVLATTADGRFTRLGTPAGLEGFGGVDFDDAVLKHVLAAVDADSWAGLDGAEMEPGILRALAKLRAASVAAKERLSVEPTASIAVALDGELITVALERAEFDALIAGMVARSVACFTDVVAAAGIRPEDLSCVLLTGGSVQIPLVTQALADALPEGVQILRAIDPKARVAAGAVLSLRAAELVAATVPQRGADLAVAHARAFFESQSATATTVPASSVPSARDGRASELAVPAHARAAVPASAASAIDPPSVPPARPAPPLVGIAPLATIPTAAPAAPEVPALRIHPPVAEEPVVYVARQRRRLITMTRAGVVVLLTGSVLVGAGFWSNAETPTAPAPVSTTAPTAGVTVPEADKPTKAERQRAKAELAKLKAAADANSTATR